MLFAALATIAAASCDESVGNPGRDLGSGGGVDGGAAVGGIELTFEVPESGRVYINLSEAAVVTPVDGMASTAWDLALSGYDVLTNSGPSGPGEGAGFGPLDAVEIFADTKPEVPFVSPDSTGGAFLDWWKYDNAAHVIWSRYHVYGVKDADRLWKVQVLSFYGEEQGAPVSARYQVRYAEVTSGSAGPIQALMNIDGTAGGPSPSDDVPSECLDLVSGSRFPLTPAAALASKAWHLCFRRSEIRVNGEFGGPKGVGAVDIDAAKTSGETLEVVKMKTADTELARFEGIDHNALSSPDVAYRGDHIVTAFTDLWLLPGPSPHVPREASWLVIGADGKSSYVIVFDKFQGATAKSPGKVTMRVKAVQ